MPKNLGGLYHLIVAGNTFITRPSTFDCNYFFNNPKPYTFGNFSMESKTESSFNSFYGKNINYDDFKESFENFKPELSKNSVINHNNAILDKNKRLLYLPIDFDTNNKIQYIQERREKIQRNLIIDTKKLNLFLPDDIAKLISDFCIK